ncbi:hypothetical protein BCV70DRAFT_201186 [Testicularia cyperi]|uniref:MICOS complex subunit n=1 Tax=Testicularia cyperi TaxID=1882483 RepID=A0A317XMA5_9BASI|nr:hypothetical protein BCV70DRAFT_201186 [Testicularia cyperi]
MSSRLVGVAAATALVGTSVLPASRPIYNEEAPTSASKLSIYPSQDPKVQVVPVQTELERQIGSARRHVSHFTEGTRHTLFGLVDDVISMEKSVEKEVKSVVPSNEPLTPGLLYVGVATLAGSIFTRYRAFPIRFLTPPIALFASLNYFNPSLAHNLSSYYEDVERKHAPSLTTYRHDLINSFNSYKNKTEQSLDSLKHKTQHSLKDGLNKVEQQTGLKVGDVIAKKDQAKIAIQDQMKAV